MVVPFYPKAFNVDIITGMVKYVFKEKVVPVEQSNRKL